MNEKPARKCQILGLYLAARGSDALWKYLMSSENLRAVGRKWKRLGIPPDVIQEVAAYLRKEGPRKPVNKPNPDRYDPDPCPRPPCTEYVDAMIGVIEHNALRGL